jgi:hypothetical protein
MCEEGIFLLSKISIALSENLFEKENYYYFFFMKFLFIKANVDVQVPSSRILK